MKIKSTLRDLVRYCKKFRPNYYLILEGLWLLAIFAIPLYFMPATHYAYYLNKALLTRSITAIMLALVIAHWIWGGTGKINLRKVFIPTPLHVSILVFGLILSLATAFSISPVHSFWGSLNRAEGWITLASWLVFFLITSHYLRKPEQITRSVNALLISSSIASLIGISQYYFSQNMLWFFNDPVSEFNRIYSTSGNALSLSSFLAMSIPFTLGYIGYTWQKISVSRRSRILILSFLGIVVILQFWCLVLAQYSITLLLFLISPAAFFLLWSYNRRHRIILLASGIIGTILIVLATIIVIPLLAANNNTTVNTKSTVSADSLGLRTLRDGRIHFWQHTAELWWQSPNIPGSQNLPGIIRKIIGYGPENYLPLIEQDYPATDTKVIDTSLDRTSATLTNVYMDHPHNQYLYWLSTIGAFGLFAYLLILIAFGWMAYKLIRQHTFNKTIWFVLAAMAATIQYSVDVIFNPSTLSAEIIFWFSLALMASCYLKLRQGERKESYEKILPQKHIQSLGHKTYSITAGIAILAGTLIPTISQFKADVRYQNALDEINANNPFSIMIISQATQLRPQEAYYWGTQGAYILQTAIHSPESSNFNDLMAYSIYSFNKSIDCQPYIARSYSDQSEVYRFWALTGATECWDDACQDYQKADSLFHQNAIILAKWSAALYAGDQLDQATEKLSQAFKADPKWSEKSVAYPGDFTYFNRFSTELSELNKLIPIYPEIKAEAVTPETWLGHTWVGIAAYSNFTDYEKFAAEFDLAIKLALPEKAIKLAEYLTDYLTREPSAREAISEKAPHWYSTLKSTPQGSQAAEKLRNALEVAESK